MCNLMENRVAEVKKQEHIQFAVNLLKMGDLSYEKIAKATSLTVADVEEIAKELKTAKVQ